MEAQRKYVEPVYIMENKMKDLIEALTIMMKHGDVAYPTHCEHDELHVYPNSMDFTKEEMNRLDELGFFPNDDGFTSYRYGSC